MPLWMLRTCPVKRLGGHPTPSGGLTRLAGHRPIERGTAAIEVLLKAAQSDPNVQLLPWVEREFTLYALKATQGNQVRAAKLLGISRPTLYDLIKQYQLQA